MDSRLKKEESGIPCNLSNQCSGNVGTKLAEHSRTILTKTMVDFFVCLLVAVFLYRLVRFVTTPWLRKIPESRDRK
jgi:hypothetical protein